jgi:integrase
MLEDIDAAIIDRFKAWRAERIRPIQRRPSNGESTLRLGLNHLHHVFKFAVDRELIAKNPVRFMAVPKHFDRRDKKPFTGEEMLAMRQHAGDDSFLVVLLKSTGFRRSDAASLLWQEVHFERGKYGEIEHVCKKNGVRVIVPLSKELRGALDAERLRRNPLPSKPVLLTEPTPLAKNATLGLFDNQPNLVSVSESQRRRREHQIYNRIKELGNRARVPNAHPHRFRHYFAVNSMLLGASLPYVARMMGDTEETVSNAYLHIVQEIRDRETFVLNSGVGLEELAMAASQQGHAKEDTAA